VQLERPKRRFYESWWFWTLTTAVLAGVAIGVSVYELSGIQDPLVGTLGASKVN
jgi:hypothetical protein